MSNIIHLNIGMIQAVRSVLLHEFVQHLLVQIQIVKAGLNKGCEEAQNVRRVLMQMLIVAWRLTEGFQVLWVFLVETATLAC